MTDKEREGSDQLPEDAPPEQARDDSDESTRSEEETAGVPNEEGQATGWPPNAG